MPSSLSRSVMNHTIGGGVAPKRVISMPTEVLQPLNRNSPASNEQDLDVQLTAQDYMPMSTAAIDAELKNLLESMVHLEDADLEAPMPAELLVKPLPHQIIGIQWMMARESGKKSAKGAICKGGLLCDDMGLGKTVQTIGLILGNRSLDKKKCTTLIIVPLSLKEQWNSEIKDKIETDTLRVMIHHGKDKAKTAKEMQRYDVVITTYETVAGEWINEEADAKKVAKAKNQAAAPQDGSDSGNSFVVSDSPVKKKKQKQLGPLFEVDFYRIVLDEGHTIKNKTSLKAKACSALEGEFRWILTGSPMQNGPEDLFSLFRFLGDTAKPYNEWHKFKTDIVTPLKANRGRIVTKRIQAVLATLLLRRTKTMTLENGKALVELPARNVRVITIAFSDPKEQDFYTALKDRTATKFKAYRDPMSSYMQILTLLLRLRQATSHPFLVTKQVDRDDALDGTAGVSQEVDELADAFAGVGVTKVCSVCQVELEDGHPCGLCQESAKAFSASTSTKIRETIRILTAIQDAEPRRKVIIFSQWTSTFDLLGPVLQERGFKFVKFVGSMVSDKREAALSKFKDSRSTNIMLISLKCGSLGLNLTAASAVIMMDLWWNGAIEDQAIDRSHRMGQTHDVDVYKLIIKDSIDEKVLQIQEGKREMSKVALGDGAGAIRKVNKLSEREMMLLFR